MEYKKGVQLSEAFGAVLAVVLIAILVIVAIILFESLSSVGIDQSRITLNEAGATIENSGYTLANAGICGFANPSITQAANTTSGQVITSGNFTLSSAGVLTNATNLEWGAVSLNYTYTDKGATCNATDTMITQFATYPALVGLVGTIVFLGLVIGVLVTSFVFGNRRV